MNFNLNFEKFKIVITGNINRLESFIAQWLERPTGILEGHGFDSRWGTQKCVKPVQYTCSLLTFPKDSVTPCCIRYSYLFSYFFHFRCSVSYTCYCCFQCRSTLLMPLSFFTKCFCKVKPGRLL